MATTPTEQELADLCSALLSGFDQRGLLTLMGEELALPADQIKAGRELATVVRELVGYYACEGNGLQVLLTAAARVNPDNAQIRMLVKAWHERVFAPIDLPNGHPYVGAESRGIAVGGDVTNSSVVSGDGNTFIFYPSEPTDSSRQQEQKLQELDKFYRERQGLSTDLRVLIWTSVALLSVSGVLWCYILWQLMVAEAGADVSWHRFIGFVLLLVGGGLLWAANDVAAVKEAGRGGTLAAVFVREIEDVWGRLTYRQKYLGDRGADLRYDHYAHGPFPLDIRSVYVTPALRTTYFGEMSGGVVERTGNSDSKGKADRVRYDGYWDLRQKIKMREKGGILPFAVVAGPGLGKSLLLKHIIAVQADGWRQRREYRAHNEVPILLRLYDLKRAGVLTSSSDVSLAEAIDYLYRRLFPPRGWVYRQLRNGRCVVLLDGLDEIADPDNRKALMMWVNRERNIFKRTRFVVASRPHAYAEAPLGGEIITAMLPFSGDRIKELVLRWYRVNREPPELPNDDEAHRDVDDKTMNFLQKLANRSEMQALASNPMLLTLMLNVFERDNVLPNKRLKLLYRTAELLLGRLLETPDLPVAKRREVLEVLAFQMMYLPSSEVDVEQAVKILAAVPQAVGFEGDAAQLLTEMVKGTGLIGESEQHQTYFFAHAIFQYYFAAGYAYSKNLVEVMEAYVNDRKWHEVIRFYCAMGDATPIITACLHAKPVKFDLAMNCLKEARSVRIDALADIDRFIEMAKTDPAIRARIRQEMATMRNEDAFPLSDDHLSVVKPIRHVEYQVFLFDWYDTGRYLQPDHWTKTQFEAADAMEVLVGMRTQDVLAFLDWLNDEEAEQGWRYRLPHIDEFGPDGVLATWANGPARLWVRDGERLVCRRPDDVEPISEDVVKRQIVDDVIGAGDFVGAEHGIRGHVTIMKADVDALLRGYDFERSQLVDLMGQARANLMMVEQWNGGLAPVLAAAGDQFARQAGQWRTESEGLAEQIGAEQTEIAEIEAQRMADRRDVEEHYREELSDIVEKIARVRGREDEVRQWRGSEHRKIETDALGKYARFERAIEEKRADLVREEAKSQEKHDEIRKSSEERQVKLDGDIEDAQQRYHRASEHQRQNEQLVEGTNKWRVELLQSEIAWRKSRIKIWEGYGKKYEIARKYLTMHRDRIRELEQELRSRRRVTKARNDDDGLLTQRKNEVVSLQQTRKGLPDEERKAHIAEDKRLRQVRKDYEDDLARLQGQLDAQRKNDYAQVEEVVRQRRQEIEKEVKPLEKRWHEIQQAQKRALGAVNEQYAGALGAAQRRIEKWTQDQGRYAEDAELAQGKSEYCAGFGQQVGLVMARVREGVDRFDDVTMDFFGDAETYVRKMVQIWDRLGHEAADLVRLVNEVDGEGGRAVEQFCEWLAQERGTFGEMGRIVVQRKVLEDIVHNVWMSVETIEPVRLKRLETLNRVSPKLGSAVQGVKDDIGQGYRQFTVEATDEVRAVREGYMRLVLLTGALSMLDKDAIAGDNHSLSRKLLAQYVKLLMVRERRAEKLQAFEGLRLMREAVVPQ